MKPHPVIEMIIVVVFVVAAYIIIQAAMNRERVEQPAPTIIVEVPADV